MTRLFLRCLGFLAGLCLLAFALNAILMWGIHRKQTGDYGLWNRMMDGDINAQLLISGSSRALVGIDSRRLAKATGWTCCNMAMDGARLEAQAALLETYLSHNRAPTVLIQNVDMFSLEPLDRVYQPSLYAPYLREPALYAYTLSVDRSFRFHRYLPLYSFALDKIMIFNALWVLLGRDNHSWEYRFDGYLPRDRAWDGSFDRFVKEHPEGRTYRSTPAGIAHLKRIVTLAHEHGVRLILIYPPELRRNMEITRNRAAMMQTFRDLAGQCRVPFVDFSESPLCNEQACFYNSQHLNRGGAERFTDELAGRIRTLVTQPPL